MNRADEGTFETMMKTILANGYMPFVPEAFDREREILPDTLLAIKQMTQMQEPAKRGAGGATSRVGTSA